MKKWIKSTKSLWITLLFFIAVVVIAVVLITSTGNKVTDTQAQQLESSLTSAAVNAYAITGRYPSLEEIIETYGTVVDTEHFYVFYDRALGDNNMPDIRVSVKEEYR